MSDHDLKDLKAAQIALEQGHVDQVNERLVELRAEADELLRDALRTSRIGTRAALVDRDVKVAEAEHRIRVLDAAHEEAVFGRLDMRDGEVRYIARIGVRTPDQEPLAIDWRAPAAEPFYRATPEQPYETVRRRVLHNRLGRVIDLEDDLLDPDAPTARDMPVVGDGAFIAALARTREGRMRDIVATIQRDQDDVVRAPADASVILRGGPGTGKTAVALHRVAWLLFGHRRRFGARGALVIGPNPRFTAYIDRVLPSLGEDGATLRSLGDLVSGVDASRYDAPAVAALKGAADMADVLRRAVTLGPPRAPQRLRLVHRGTVVTLDDAQLAAVRREAMRARRTPVRPNAIRAHVATLLHEAAWRRYVALCRGAAGAGDSVVSETDADAREAFLDRVSDDPSVHEFMAAWWPVRTPLGVLRDLGDARWLRHVAGRRLDGDAVALLAADWAGLDGHGPSYQDVALVDELADLLGEAPPPPPDADPDEDDWGVAELTTYAERTSPRRSSAAPLDDGPAEYAHIVVDEAQDLSPMQWRMLGRRGRHATWTVVADAAQSAWQDAIAAAKAMDEALGGRPRREFELTVNYRNPAEIAAVAAALLPEAQPGAVPARAVRAGGRRPELIEGGDLPALARGAVERLLGEVQGTIGVIVADTGVTRTVDWFTGLPDRVQPLGALDAKGLEFDAVVLVDAARVAAESPVGVRTLYVAVTRATQALVLVGPVPPTLRAAVAAREE